MVLISNNSQGCVINTWIDTINCANFNIKAMHERNAHNFSYRPSCC